VQLVQLAHQVLEQQVLLVFKVRQDHRVLPDQLAHQVLEQQVLLVFKVRQDHREI
jgi:hypothetical protein